MPNLIQDLPDELLPKIVRCLPVKDRLSFGATCKDARDAIETNALWRGLIYEKFGEDVIFPDRNSEGESEWKELYKHVYQWLQNVESQPYRLNGPYRKTQTAESKKHGPFGLDLEPILASSTDGDQSLHYTVRPDYFWSSRPNPDKDSNEYLLYALPGLCIIDRVEIIVMQSRKAYPPESFSYEVGLDMDLLKERAQKYARHEELESNVANLYSSPTTMTPLSSLFHINTTPVKDLPLAVGTHLCVHLNGKRSTHFATGLQDEYYTCLNQVTVYGWCIDPLLAEEGKLSFSSTISRAIMKRMDKVQPDLRLGEDIARGRGYMKGLSDNPHRIPNGARRNLWGGPVMSVEQLLMAVLNGQVNGFGFDDNDFDDDYDMEEDSEDSEYLDEDEWMEEEEYRDDEEDD